MLRYDRYILRELLWNFAFTFVTISVIFMIGGAVDIIYRASTLDPLLFMLALPLVLLNAMALVIPLSVLVSVVMTYGRVSADGEITTLKSVGVHPFTLLSPALCLAAFATLTTLVINDRLSPKAGYQAKNLLKESNVRKLLEMQISQGNRSFNLSQMALTWADEEIVAPTSALETRSLPFLVIGPFPEIEFAQEGPPESPALDPSAKFITEEGKERQWIPVRLDANARLDPRKALGASEGIYYAVTHIRSPRSGWVRLTLSDIDHVGVHYGGSWRGWKGSTLDLHLEPGWNELMLKMRIEDGPRTITVDPQLTEEGERLMVAVLGNPGSICLYDITLTMPRDEGSDDDEELRLTVADLAIIGFETTQRKITMELRGFRVLSGGATKMNKVKIERYYDTAGNRIRLKQRTGPELFALLSRLKRQPENAVSRATVEAQLHDRLVVATACFVFVLIGLPIAVIFRSANRAVSFVLAFAVVLFFYYPTLILGRSLAEQAAIDPALAMWSGNGLLGLLGVALLIAVVRR